MAKTDTEILAERARALAAARPEDAIAAEVRNSERYLMAVCGRERIAIRLTSVAEVYRPVGVTPLPRPTPPVWGLAAWRGRIITIAKIGECSPDAGAGLVAVMSEGQEVFAGVWLNNIEGEITLSPSEIGEHESASADREGFLSGITANAVLVLSGSKLKSILEREPSSPGKAGVMNSTRSAG